MSRGLADVFEKVMHVADERRGSATCGDGFTKECKSGHGGRGHAVTGESIEEHPADRRDFFGAVEHEKNFDCFERSESRVSFYLELAKGCPDLTQNGECLIESRGGNEELPYGPTRPNTFDLKPELFGDIR